MSSFVNCCDVIKQRECEDTVEETNIVRIPVVNRAAVIILCDNCCDTKSKCASNDKKHKKCCN
jgi:hypothetical protein